MIKLFTLALLGIFLMGCSTTDSFGKHPGKVLKTTKSDSYAHHEFSHERWGPN